MTKTTKVPVTFKCGKCGTPVSFDNDADDETMMSCPNCGQDFGTYAEIRRRARVETKKQVTAAMKKIFKR